MMRPRHPVTLYRPLRTDRRDGTLDESQDVTLIGTIYVTARVHDAAEAFVADASTDVRVADFLVADAGTYRVTGVDRVLGAPHKVLSVERLSKPLVPGVVEVGS